MSSTDGGVSENVPNRIRSLVMLALVAALFCVPLFRGLQAVDQENDEAIYSYAAESILETGDWLNPRSSPTPDVTFLEKPPLKFWIVALPIRVGLLPDNDFGLRFWDALFGSLAFLYIFSIGRGMAGWPCGAVAVLVLYTFDDLLFTHGLRGNNMEASLVLAYAGGIYHYTRWTEADRPAQARAHAFAVGGYFFLAFMTKFVAALFLPAVIAAASLELPAVRAKAWKERRTWLAVVALAVLLIAPWFAYQTVHAGSAVWSIMFGEHVVTRFRTSLDAEHIKPWPYYFESLFSNLVRNHTWWAVLPGAILIHLRAVRARWLAGSLVLHWFWLPFILMSVGSSKLPHYAYPFLAPVGLAAGYFVGSASSMAGRVIAAITAPSRRRAFRLPPAVGTVATRLRPAMPWLQGAMLIVGAGLVVHAAIGQFFPGRWHVLGVSVRAPQLLRAALSALLLGLLAGRGAWMARLAVPVCLLAFLPVAEYRYAVERTQVQAHPMRSTRDCIADVRRSEEVAGRPVRDMSFDVPPSGFRHSFFFYYRHFGWKQGATAIGDEELTRMLDDPALQRPVLLPDDWLSRLLSRPDPAGPVTPSVLVAQDVRVALPGPYSRCAF